MKPTTTGRIAGSIKSFSIAQDVQSSSVTIKQSNNSFASIDKNCINEKIWELMQAHSQPKAIVTTRFIMKLAWDMGGNNILPQYGDRQRMHWFGLPVYRLKVDAIKKDAVKNHSLDSWGRPEGRSLVILPKEATYILDYDPEQDDLTSEQYCSSGYFVSWEIDRDTIKI